MIPPEDTSPHLAPDEIARWRAAFQRIEGGFERFYEEAQARIADLKRRETLWDEKLESLLRTLERERASWLRALEDERGRLQAEYAKARLAEEKDLGRRFQRIEERIESMAPPAERILEKLAELGSKWEQALEAMRPPWAKDAAIAALEAERAELMKALTDREAAFQSYMSQRRGFEKALGDRLFELERRLDAERQKGITASLSASEEEARRKTLEERIGVAEKALADREAVSREKADRDQTLLARLREELEATRRELEEARKALREESATRARDEEAVATLTVELQKASATAAAANQEKEETVARFAPWAEEKKKLQAALAEKDALLKLFEAYFKER